MPLLTVFTPAYNRAHTLPRTYESLRSQSCKDFVWLIVDDGSVDNTAELVREWQHAENGFEIRYIYKENGGMHTAHNAAYENIDTELNVCIDSDDCLARDAINIIRSAWESIQNKDYAGLVGLDADMQGHIIGNNFPETTKGITLSEFYAQGGKGDKKLVYRTEIIKKYPPYPVFPGEKYVALAYKYILIDQDYKLLPINQILCNVEYQMDGSSNTMWRQYLKNPQGFAFWRTIQARYPSSALELVKNTIHYCSSKQIAKRQGAMVPLFPYKILEMLCAPLGVLLTVYVYHRNRNV